MPSGESRRSHGPIKLSQNRSYHGLETVLDGLDLVVSLGKRGQAVARACSGPPAGDQAPPRARGSVGSVTPPCPGTFSCGETHPATSGVGSAAQEPPAANDMAQLSSEESSGERQQEPARGGRFREINRLPWWSWVRRLRKGRQSVHKSILVPTCRAHKSLVDGMDFRMRGRLDETRKR